MRVLVLGGTGLISTYIVRQLLDSGHEPIVFNRGLTESRVGANIETVTGDRYDLEAFERAVNDIEFEAVIDMITFTADVAAHSVKLFSGRIEHYLFCSTVCVYGGPLPAVPADEATPQRPVSLYGEGKSQAEAEFMAAFHETGFPVTIFRPSHCYGPGQPLLDIWGYSGALISRLREQKPIVVPGDGYGLWQPGFVGDVAKGFVGALGRELVRGKAYNVVGDEVMTWRDFHHRAAAALGASRAKLFCLTTDQICAGAPSNRTSMLREIFQFHAAYTNAALKADVPEYRDLLPWEVGVQLTAAWADETGANEPASAQPWVDELSERADSFLKSMLH